LIDGLPIAREEKEGKVDTGGFAALLSGLLLDLLDRVHQRIRQVDVAHGVKAMEFRSCCLPPSPERLQIVAGCVHCGVGVASGRSGA
jgi:hypothetical protein